MAAFKSKLAVRAIMWLANSGTHILVYLPVTYVPEGATSNEKTLGFTRVFAQGATCIQTRPRVQFRNRILHIKTYAI